ncbi:toxin-antitoxin system protein [Blastococcus sp. CT_GayMR16]|uniref:ribbon-helix-helix protein n=1 Tax=Blastococcus sp. CT_GayMR16 TaxID=2559607 RepID=UPI00107477BC|nr:toxin-antitoxin system protein [Blastococcus sp. CT_GayMR16]TFV90346.1 toxin-antitoxin system protein [Blastococcus sp. CT_GayMR16]
MPDLLTTIKVPKSLRERIAIRAGEQRMTAAEVIAGLLDDADRRARFDAVRAAYDQADASYREETEAWDSLADDGLHP